MALRLKELRRKRKLSQRQLSKRAGVSRSYISELESGKYDPTRVICRLKKALNCSFDELINCEVNEDDRG
jgi:transcriptional regulator with XRE-family HTH domain